MGYHKFLLFAAGVAAAGAIAFVSSEAEACSWPVGSLTDISPQPDAQVVPQAQFSLWFTPGVYDEPDFELVDGDDERVDVDLDTIRVSQASNEEVTHFIATPVDDLEPGDYTLTVSSQGTDPATFGEYDPEDTGELSLSYEVVDDEAPSAEAPEEFHWIHTDIEVEHDSCYNTDRLQWHEIEVASDSGDGWYEIHYEGGGETTVASQPTQEATRHHLDHEVECVTVKAVGADGLRSEALERCEPDVCQNQINYDAPYDESDNAYEDADCPGEVDNDDDGGDEKDEADDATQDSESTCTAVGGTAPSGSILVLLAALFWWRRSDS